MRFKVLLTTLLTALISTSLQASPTYPVPERYEALFEKVFSGSDYAIEVRSGTADTKFEVNAQSIVKPSQAFLENSEASEWTVDSKDSGVTSVNGVTFVYVLEPNQNEDSDKSHSLELLVMQAAPDGRHSSFRVKAEFSPGEWVELVSMDRSEGDVEKYAYIIVRLRNTEHGPDDKASGKSSDKAR